MSWGEMGGLGFLKIKTFIQKEVKLFLSFIP